jgi:hypothetical protein
MNRTAQLAVALAAGRIGFGIALAAAPEPVGTSWIGEDARHKPAQAPIRGIGARDIALAGGIVLAAIRGDDMRPWLAGCALSDVADVGAMLAAGSTVPGRARVGTLLLAGGSAIANAALTAAAGDA